VKIAGREQIDEIQDEDDVVSLCSLYAGSEMFGIDTRKIREVLGERELQRVPMSPAFIAGVVPYRGEVLTTVDLRALLGMAAHAGAVRAGGGRCGRSGYGEQADVRGQSLHAGGSGKVAVRWGLQDGCGADGATRSEETFAVTVVGGGIVQEQFEWRHRCEP
jgi:hypothetical protein